MMHVFEAANLGKAPFEFRAQIDLGKVRSSCDYCGTGIRHVFLIRSADGKHFEVGSECVYKTHDAALVEPVKRSIRDSRNRVRRELREARNRNAAEKRRLAELVEMRNAARKVLSELPEAVRKALRVHRDSAANLDNRARSVITDMRFRVARGAELSGKAQDYLLSIVRDAYVTKVEVPESDGRVRIVGRIASIKHDEDYGWRMVVEVPTERGSYKVFGSVPMVFFDKISWMMDELNERAHKAWEAGDEDNLFWNSRFFKRPEMRKFLGTAIEFDARVVRSSRDPSFGFFKRPTKLAVSWPAPEEWVSWCREVEGGAAMPDSAEVF